MKKFTRAVCAVAAVAAMLPLATTAGASTADTQRLAGADRYATSAVVSRHISAVTPQSIPFVFVASGLGFADGLAAGSAAGAINGRLLLVPKDGVLPASVSGELKRLGKPSIVIAGGTGSVSSVMESQLRQHASEITRLDGVDRYETAAMIGFGAPGDTAFLAAGDDFPDALAGGAAAGGLQSALLLTAKSGLPAQTIDTLKENKPAKIVVLGGRGVIDDVVLTKAKAVVPTATVTRVAGASRYETAAATSRYAFPSGSPVVYLASGVAFPDALSAGPAAGGVVAPLLLSAPNCVPKATLAEIKRLGATKFVAVGGTGVLSQKVIDRVPC